MKTELEIQRGIKRTREVSNPSGMTKVRESELLGIAGENKVKPLGRNSQSSPVTIIPYGSQEAAPAATAPYTDQMAPRLVDHFNPEEAAKLGISMYPAIIKPNIPRQGEGDWRDAVNEEYGIRNWDNVFEVYKKHYIAVAATLLQNPPSIAMGVGGDHGMAASTLRATALACGIRDICDGKIVVSDEFKSEIIAAREEFAKNPNENSLKNLGQLIDNAIELEPNLGNQWKQSMHTIGVVWFDAHGDINTPMSFESGPNKAKVEIIDGELVEFKSSSGSGNFHGMPVAVAMGFGPKPMVEFGSKYANVFAGNIVYLACRDLDQIEEDAINQLKPLGLELYTPEQLQAVGMEQYTKSINKLISKGADRIIIEHDVDGANAARYSATGTPVGPGSSRNPNPGPSHHQTRQAVRNLSITYGDNIVSIDVAEGSGRPSAENTANIDSKISVQDAIETFHSSVQIIDSFLGLTTEQKNSVFPGALQQIDTDFHNQTKLKSVESEMALQGEGKFINLVSKQNKSLTSPSL